ncbi:MAG TPA: ribosome-associated translation inhibitor RaiA [Sandaracinaceae bacterium LLY-WYZ-13_1]|nr:ribosome-associated translation inhibitor RaiA [Sandaracinaceae bacterium LLY-WYZ-13_1]
MEIQHTAKDFDLTDAIRDHAEEKFQKACTQLEGFQGVRLHLTYQTVGHSKHGENQCVTALCFVPNSEPLKAEETTSDLYASIDAAAKDIDRQVRKYREKFQSQQRRG